MEGLRAKRADRTPLFASVGDALKREIAAGRFAQADLLPGERELSAMLDVSRTTLRRAIAGLVDEGVLVHRHGAGTFVRRSPPHVEQPLSRLTSFTEDMRLRGLTASSQGDRARRVPANAGGIDDARHLSQRDGVSSGAPAPCRRRADGDRAGRGAAAFSRRRPSRRGFALRGARSVRLSSRAGAAAAARRGDRCGRRRRCSGFRKDRRASTSIASPISPMGGGSSSPAPSIARTPMTSSRN